MEFDQVAVEHLFEEFDYVLLDDAGRRFVGCAEGGYQGRELGGLGEETPDFRASVAEAEALARIEGHEDDFGADCGLDGRGAADYGDVVIDSHALES